MPEQRVERKLVAILAADVAGYSRLVGLDEEGTLARLKTLRRQVIDPEIASHRGRIVKTTGDGLLIEFVSVVDAVCCAVAVQQTTSEREAGRPEDQRIQFRVGINLGDIVVEGEDILGDGVNIAARLEGIADPGGICISEDVFRQVQGRVEVEFNDLGDQQLKNIARPIRAYSVMLQKSGSIPSSPLPLPDKPSIAVLPFQNMSGDPEQEYFADGMVEEIITALSRIRWLFVIARNSSFTYKGQAIDVKRVGRELGVRYLVEGSVRKWGGRVRIAAQLIDADIGAHLWADHFDGSIEDVFDLQDKVAISVAAVIEPTLQAAEIRRSIAHPTADLSAYDLYLRALQHGPSHSRDGTVEALSLLTQAITRDPNYGAALAIAAHCHMTLYVSGWSNDPEAHRREGINMARRALRVASDDAAVLGRAAYVLGNFGEEVDTAIALIDRSLEMNPSFASGWGFSGWLRLWSGQFDAAIDHFKTGLRLSPQELGRNLLGTGICYFFAGRFEEARAAFLQAIEQRPEWVPNYRFLAACCAHMGRIDEARDVVERLRQLTDVVIPTATHWRNLEQREFYLSGLRLACATT